MVIEKKTFTRKPFWQENAEVTVKLLAVEIIDRKDIHVIKWAIVTSNWTYEK